MTEYYIRQPDSEDARGPFDLQKIADLVEAKQADKTTLYYDEEQDDWLPVWENIQMREVLFPEKKSLSLKAKEAVKNPLNVDNLPEVSVNSMLAAAEGTSKETKHLKAKQKSLSKAGSVSLPAISVMLLFLTVTSVFADQRGIAEIWDTFDLTLFFTYPSLIFALFDGFAILCCLLGATEIYPFIRARALIALGYFGYTFWAWQDFPKFILMATSCLALYLCTISRSFVIISIIAIIGIIAAAFLTYSTMGGAIPYLDSMTF